MKKKANKKNYDGWMRRFWDSDRGRWNGFYSGFSKTKKGYLEDEGAQTQGMSPYMKIEKLVKVKIRIVV